MLKISTIGDMSRNFGLQRQTSDLKQALERLGSEVVTGRTTDIAKSVNGDFLPLNAIETAIKRLGRYQDNLVESQTFVEAGQRALETISERALNMGANLMTVSSSAEITVVEAVTNDARDGLDSIISAFNIQVGGRGVFGGMATNSAALAGGDVMMNDIMATLGGATTAQDVVDAVTAWFDDPAGGFETIGYTGSTQSILAFDLGDGNRADFDFRADDSEARNILKGFALAASLSVGVSLVDPSERQALVRQAGEMLLTAEKDLAQYRANVGVTEAAIADAQTNNASRKSAMEFARADIIAVDQYDAAGDLEATQVQLEMLYTITARMSRLNLMEFLR